MALILTVKLVEVQHRKMGQSRSHAHEDAGMAHIFSILPMPPAGLDFLLHPSDDFAVLMLQNCEV